jgi:dihydroorotate dehydrogenase (NAD+) catalytic subunit
MVEKYNAQQTWEWNLARAPETDSDQLQTGQSLQGDWKWCGIPIHSPLGISAGPLLDSRWLLYYATLGFDALVYKTVRSSSRACYPLPNLVPVDVSQLSATGTTVTESASMNGSWAVSFGMPSQSPDVWRDDVTRARDHLPTGKVLIVSVVGTQDVSVSDPQRSLEQLAADFACCAKWAVDAGAHGVEANFSCPNVSTADGQLYQQPKAAGFVAERIREQIGVTPLVLKIGHVSTPAEAEELIAAVCPHVNGIAMTNSIAARVISEGGRVLFDGNARGICGSATISASVAQVRLFRDIIACRNMSLDLIGVGGISEVQHVRDYLKAGAASVAMATAAMVDPDTGLRIRSEW